MTRNHVVMPEPEDKVSVLWVAIYFTFECISGKVVKSVRF